MESFYTLQKGAVIMLATGFCGSALFASTANAATLFSDDFESGFGGWSNTTNGDNKNWTRDSGGTTSSGTGPSSGANGSNYYVYLETSSGSAYQSGDSAILLSPALNASGVKLGFDYHMYGSNIGSLAVDVLSGGSWLMGAWTLSGQQQVSNGSGYSHVEVDLSAYSTEQIRLRATAAGSYRGDIAIDNVVITSQPTGPVAPVVIEDPLIKAHATQDQAYSGSLVADVFDANGDTLLFTKISGPSWLTVSVGGDLLGTPSLSDVGVSVFEFEVSDGSLSTSFFTNILVNDDSEPIVLLSDDFESGLGNWNNVSGVDNKNWLLDSGGTPSSGTGPLKGAQDSSFYVYLETSSSAANSLGDVAILESSPFTGSNLRFSFSYHMYGSDIGTLAVDVLSDGSWVNGVWELSGQQQANNSAAYTAVEVDLSAYQASQLRLRAVANGGFRGDVAIDNVNVFSLNPGSVDSDSDGIVDVSDICPNTPSTELADENGCSVSQRDSDNDGFSDADDAFPSDPLEWLDTDSDAVGNNADKDDDGDGVLDIDDAFPLDATESIDTDGDGVGNSVDSDDDNDGVNDVGDAFPLDPNETLDTDSDGVGNNADTDDDNDTFLDVDDAFPLDSSEWADSDADGIGDNSDPFPNDPNTLNKTYLHGQILYEFSGDNVSDQFGTSVSARRDVDNDGVDDFIVGAPQPITGGIGGYARVYSGVDGSVIHTINGTYNRQKLGSSVALIGDLNGDGSDDILIGAPGECAYSGNTDTGSAMVYSGADGVLLYTFSGDALDDCFGYSVDSAGDVDLDGIDDLVVGTRYRYVRVFSGVDGSIIRTLQASVPNEAIGQAVSGAGDVNGDGAADIITGSKDFHYVEVFSGSDGASLYSIRDSFDFQLGDSVGAAGDVNQDGYDDFAVGRSWYNTPSTKSGQISVYSGQNGTELWTKSGNGTFQGFGKSFDVADMDNDGITDLVVGTFGDIVDGRVEVLEGLSGSRISNNRLGSNTNGFGSAISSIGDLNGDGIAEIVVGAYLDSTGGSSSGKVFVLGSQLDSDGDGTPDASDAAPFDPNTN